MDELAQLMIVASELAIAAHVQVQLSERCMRDSVSAVAAGRTYAADQACAQAQHATSNASVLYRNLRKIRSRIRALKSHG